MPKSIVPEKGAAEAMTSDLLSAAIELAQQILGATKTRPMGSDRIVLAQAVMDLSADVERLAYWRSIVIEGIQAHWPDLAQQKEQAESSYAVVGAVIAWEDRAERAEQARDEAIMKGEKWRYEVSHTLMGDNWLVIEAHFEHDSCVARCYTEEAAKAIVSAHNASGDVEEVARRIGDDAMRAARGFAERWTSMEDPTISGAFIVALATALTSARAAERERAAKVAENFRKQAVVAENFQDHAAVAWDLDKRIANAIRGAGE